MKIPNSYLHKVGFTMLELLLLISMIGILLAITTSYLWGSLEKKRLIAQTTKVEFALREMQQKSTSAQNGRSYGVFFYQTKIITAPEGKEILLENGVKLKAFDSPTVFFEKLSGLPIVQNKHQSLELVLVSSLFSTRVEINENGVITAYPPEHL